MFKLGCKIQVVSYQRVAIKWGIFFFFFFVYFRDPKDQGEIRVTWAIMVREDRKDTVDSLACRVFLDLRYVQAVLVSSPVTFIHVSGTTSAFILTLN